MYLYNRSIISSSLILISLLFLDLYIGEYKLKNVMNPCFDEREGKIMVDFALSSVLYKKF